MAASMAGCGFLQEPAYCRLKLDITVKIKEELKKAKNGLVMLSKLQAIHAQLLQETKLIHIIISGRNAQLRREKSMQLLKRVKACLQRVNLLNRLFSLGADLLEDVGLFSCEEECGYLPCKQSWTYLLYLVSRYHQLLQQTVAYCLSTFHYLCSDLGIRHLIQVKVTFMGICARVWQACTTLSDKLAGVYNQLFSVEQNTEAARSDWKCPGLPRELSRLINSPQPNILEERELKKCLDQTKPDSPSSVKENASSLNDLSGCLPMSEELDDEEDLGVAVSSIDDHRRSIKRKAEPGTVDDFPKIKRNKNEKNEFGENKKKKKKNLVKTFDGDIVPKKKKKSKKGHEDGNDTSGNILKRNMDSVKKSEKIKSKLKADDFLSFENNKTPDLKKKKKKKKISVLEGNVTEQVLSLEKSFGDNFKLREKGKRKKKTSKKKLST